MKPTLKSLLRVSLSLLTIGLVACGGPQRTDNTFRFSTSDNQYTVEFRAEDMVRILVQPVGEELTTERLAVLPQKEHAQLDIEVLKTEDAYEFTTENLRVKFAFDGERFSFYDASSKMPILREEERVMEKDSVGGEKCLRIQQRFLTEEGEALYGLGQYQTGAVDLKRDTVILLQSNKDIVLPYLVSTRGYAVLWDNYSSTEFRDGGAKFEFESEVADAVDYWVVWRKTTHDCVKGYRELTGKASMLPKWAFGFWQSKERYKTFEELEGVVKEYRKRAIPLDVIVQDWEYWGDKPHWNSLKWNEERFPNPEEVIARLHNQYGVRLMLSVWPGFGPKTAVYDDLKSIGALFEERTWAGYKVFDAYNNDARDVVWRHLREGLVATGVDGWWMDATEPSFRDGFTQRKQEARSKSAGQTAMGAFHRYLNTYSLVWMKDLYGRMLEERPDCRPFFFTRSAFSGQQHYGTAVWSGDVIASWENLKKQISGGVNLSAAGFPYWTFDIGGFVVSGKGGNYPKGLKDEAYRELYARWFQFGSLLPIFRAHGTDVPREVWQFGDENSVHYRNQLKYIRLRYELMPYIYATAHEVVENDALFFEALGMAFPEDRAVWDCDEAYMFGKSLLVRPVLEPMAKGKKVQQVATLLPRNKGGWYDFFTGEHLKGEECHMKACDLMTLPLYVRGGSILVMAPMKQSVMLEDKQLTIHIYEGEDGEFTLYDDSGEGFGYTKGEYSQIEMEWEQDERTLTLADRAGHLLKKGEQQPFDVVLHLKDGKSQKKHIVYEGEEIEVKF